MLYSHFSCFWSDQLRFNSLITILAQLTIILQNSAEIGNFVAKGTFYSTQNSTLCQNM